MLRKKGFWYFLMSGSILLWIAVILLGFVIFPNRGGVAWVVLGILILIHCAEIPLSLKIAKARGLSTAPVVLKTMLFGFTWWVPLKKGVISS